MEWFLLFLALGIVCIVAYFWSSSKDSGQVEERIAELSTKYSPKMNRFQARKEVKPSSARTELAGQLVNEMVAVANLNEGQVVAETSEFHRRQNLEKLNRVLELESDEHRIALAQNDLTYSLIGKAASEEMDVATYLELKKKVEMDRLDLDKQWQEAEQQLKAGFIFQLQAHQHLALMTEYIGKLYDRAKELETQGKDREYRLIEEHIEFMEGDFRGRQKRLVQADNEEDIQGSDEDTEITGDD